MKKYIDRSFLSNPVTEYFKWFFMKARYQFKYYGNHLRIGYKNRISNVEFGKYNWTARHVFLNNCKIGDYTYISEGTVIQNADVGKFCSIGPNVKIAPGRHPTSTFVTTYPSFFYNPPNLLNNFVKETVFEYSQKVIIGNDVWIGANSVLVDGITIADGAIIGANSVVTKNVNQYEIVGGIPSKVIRKRFTEKQIVFLNKFEWWNKDDRWLKENVKYFWSVEKFERIFDV